MDVIMPQLGETVTEGVVTRWYKKIGEPVKADELLFDVETDKVSTEIPAPASGIVAEILVGEGVMAKVGERLAVIRESHAPAAHPASGPLASAGAEPGGGAQRMSPTAEHEAEIAKPPLVPRGAGAQDRLSPAVRKLIAEHSLDPHAIRGTGREERIKRDDVTAHLAERARQAVPAATAQALSPSDLPPVGRVEAADVERVARARDAHRKVAVPLDADRLEQSPSKMIEIVRLGEAYKHAIPSTVSIAISCQKVNRRLQQLSDQIGPVSLLELTLHDVARVLADYPDLNGFYADGQAWRYKTIAVGFAINLGQSLRVPVVRRAAELSHIEVARAVRDLSLRYMRNELTMDDVTGGTFTITDLAGFGVVHFVPVPNARQSAILGICAERPGSGYRELVMTFDHRMADGMRAAMFLGELGALLEADPAA